MPECNWLLVLDHVIALQSVRRGCTHQGHYVQVLKQAASKPSLDILAPGATAYYHHHRQ